MKKQLICSLHSMYILMKTKNGEKFELGEM